MSLIFAKIRFLKRSFFLYRNCSTRKVVRPTFDSEKFYRAKVIPKDIWDDNKDAKYTGYEEVKDHWHYVEQLFPKLRIPTPSKTVSSTGWKAPAEILPDLPYFVGRSRNHMLGVYEMRESLDKIVTTRVCHVNGDIYAFEYDLKTYLEGKLGEKVESHVNEICCWVSFKGDIINIIKEWLYDKGF